MARSYTSFIFIFLLLQKAFSQTHDGSFNPLITGSCTVSASVLQSDNKLVMAGDFIAMGATRVSGGLVRLNVDGIVDNTFNAGSGPFATINPKKSVNTLAVQSDGKILAGGSFTQFNGQPANKLIRLNTDGSTDNGFTVAAGSTDNSIQAIAVQPDGKIVVAGYFTVFGGAAFKGIVRLNSNGSFDNTFTPPAIEFLGSGNGDARVGLIIQSDGKIIMGSQHSHVGGVARPYLVRLNSNGTEDVSFTTNLGTGFDNHITTVALQSDGKIIVGGRFTKVNSTTANRNQIARLNTNGTLELSFNTNVGFNSGNSVQAAKIIAGDKILVSGDFQNPQRRLLRLNSDGSVDNSFITGSGFETTAGGYANLTNINVQSDNKIITTGLFEKYNGSVRLNLARLTDLGAIESAYAPNPAGAATIYKISVLNNGKVLICGNFLFVGGNYSPGIARLLNSGLPDNTFGLSGITITSGNISTFGVQASNGRIVIGGNFSYASSNCLARLTADGAFDNSFSGFTSIGVSVNLDGVYAIEPTADDKFIIGGKFTTINGVTKSNFVKLNTDGSLDNTFNTAGTDFVNRIVSIDTRASDGRMILTEDFGSDNQNAPYISLANADGSRVNSFNINSKFNSQFIKSAIFLPDGKILIGGAFTSFDGVSAQKLVKVNDAGVRDVSFKNPVGYDSYLVSKLFYSSFLDRIFVGKGQLNFFTTPVDNNYFDVMQADGTLIEDNLQMNGDVNAIVPSGSALFLAGKINKIGSIDAASSIKLNLPASAPASPSSLSVQSFSTNQITLGWVANSNNETSFEIYRSVSTNANYALISTTSAGATSFSNIGLSPGTAYFYRIRAINAVGSSAYSNEINQTTQDVAPAAPSSLVIQSFTANQITLRWFDLSNNETGFEIYRSVSTNANYVLIATTAANAVNFTNTSLSPTISYFYKIRAINAVGPSAYSNEINQTTLDVAPAAPSGLAVQSFTANQINLSWVDNSTNETGVEIYRSVSTNASYSLISTTSAGATSFSNSGLSAATTYFYRIRAINATGSSAYSNEISQATSGVTVLAPSALVVQSFTSNQVNLGWIDNSDNETSFEIYRSTAVNTNYALIQASGANSVAFTDTGLAAATLYFYKVRAIRVDGASSFSNEVNTTTLPPPPVDTWSAVTTTPIPARSSGVAIVLNGKAYVGLGRNASAALKDWWEYDPTNNLWTQKLDFPGTARIGAVAFVVNGKGYVGTGNDLSNTGFKRDFYEYDANSNTWTQKANFPEDFASSAGITSGAAFSIGSFGYVGLGNTGVNNTGAFYRYNPATNVWETKASFGGSGRAGAVGFESNGKGYFGFGYGGLSASLKDMWEYNPSTDIWLKKTDYSAAGRGGSAVTTLKSEAYIFAGEEVASFFSSVRTNLNTKYSPLTDSWSQLSVIPAPIRTDAMAFGIGVKAYIYGGVNSTTYYSDLASFTPVAALVPNMPILATASVVSETSIKTIWTDESDNETNFVLEVSQGANSTYDIVAILPSGTTEYTQTGLVPGVQYRYRVKATNVSGSSPYTNMNSISTPLQAPTNVISQVLSSSIQLNWTDNSSNETGFEIYRSISTNANYLLLSTTSAGTTSFTDSGLTPATTYYYKIRSVNLVSSSSYSSEINQTTPNQTPLAPSALTIQFFNATQIGLTWTDNSSNETGFEVYRSLSTNTNYTLISTTPPDATSFTNGGLAPATTYYYRIRAVNAVGSSANSNEVAQTTLSGIPIQPSALVVQSFTATQINLGWSDNSTNETGFEVYISPLNNTSYTLVATTLANVTSFSNVGLMEGTTYYFRIRATNSLGASAYSNEVNQKTILNPPLAPSNLVIQSASTNQIVLTWNDNSTTETSFEIHRSTSTNNSYQVFGTAPSNVVTFVDNSVVPPTTYFYKVRAINSGGNSAFSPEISFLITGTEDQLNHPVVTVYPNPAKDELAIDNKGNLPIEVSIFNSLGQPISQVKVAAKAIVKLPCGEWANGMYLLKTVTNSSYSTRIIKD